MILYVYRLRRGGQKIDRLGLQHWPPVRGDLLLPDFLAVKNGPAVLARLNGVGDGRTDLLPPLNVARVRIRSGILLTGEERIHRGVKDKGERYRQSWFCVMEPRDLGEPDYSVDYDEPAFPGVFGGTPAR